MYEVPAENTCFTVYVVYKNTSRTHNTNNKHTYKKKHYQLNVMYRKKSLQATNATQRLLTKCHIGFKNI